MKAILMKRLFRVLKNGSASDVNAIRRRIMAAEKK